MSGGYRGGYRGGSRHGGYNGGRNNFQGYSGRAGGGGGNRGGNAAGRGGDQHPCVKFLWNLLTNHSRAHVNCMAFEHPTLYVGLDDGTIKIYTYNEDMAGRNRQMRFTPSQPAEVNFPNCVTKSIMTINHFVFIAMVVDSNDPGSSRIHCPNSQQNLDVPRKVEQAVICTRAQAERPSLWAATTSGTIAVVDLKPSEDPALPAGTIVMEAKAELNLDRSTHQGCINRLSEVLCAPANTSVLISGDITGVLVVWNITDGQVIQQFNPPTQGAAVTGIEEYKGTHFLVSFFTGTVQVFQFSPQPAPGQAVNPVAIATYTPPALATSFNMTPAKPGAVIAIAVAGGPPNVQGGGQEGELVDWLIVSRLQTDALEVVQLDPAFPWGGGLDKTEMCRCILPLEMQTRYGVERLILAGSKHTVKIFRWKTPGFQ